ncbi:proline-rich proteoglycan 2-like [Ostrinia nubilalis]|uniref:proline-rich proteoglycan 2-like n=1 Tax=Ostrinia furnacalis TaxID=93504 RepID=UPI0010391494|nr:proline-rich proteoglycan 2-like [Ostrinia furnacalis]
MQRFPGYNPNAPGAPMQPGYPQPGFGPHPGMGGPQRPPNQAGPCFGMGPMQAPPQQPGCFMPAATIRKISNTTPPAQFFPPPN